MKKPVLLALLILFLFTLSASAHHTTSATNGNHEILASNVELTIDYSNSTQDVFSSLVGSTVFDILNQTTTVTFTQFAFGKFIISINGIENNANNNGYYWQYWVNDELAPVAADSYVLSDGDQVLWKYCAPETTPTESPSLVPEFVLGVIIVSTVGIITVIAASIAYLKIR